MAWCARLVLAALLGALCFGSANGAAEAAVVDRVVARFTSPEVEGPRFVFERTLAFEARLEALAARANVEENGEYAEQYVRAALERHIAETLLAALRIDPEPSRAELERQMLLARTMIENAVGGDRALRAAQRAEGIGTQELRRLLRRRARASLYLHHMVAPMLAPSKAELRHVYPNSPFAGRDFATVEAALERWYVARALREAVTAFYQNARTRLKVTVLR